MGQARGGFEKRGRFESRSRAGDEREAGAREGSQISTTIAREHRRYHALGMPQTVAIVHERQMRRNERRIDRCRDRGGLMKTSGYLRRVPATVRGRRPVRREDDQVRALRDSRCRFRPPNRLPRRRRRPLTNINLAMPHEAAPSTFRAARRRSDSDEQATRRGEASRKKLAKRSKRKTATEPAESAVSLPAILISSGCDCRRAGSSGGISCPGQEARRRGVCAARVAALPLRLCVRGLHRFHGRRSLWMAVPALPVLCGVLLREPLGRDAQPADHGRRRV